MNLRALALTDARQPARCRHYEPGTRIGGQVIEAVLGVGGMGCVYRAVNDTGEVVALKVVKADLGRDDVFRKRFSREASIGERVKHPHIVPVLGSGDHDGVPFLVQPLLPGGSLAERLEREAPLELKSAVRICLAIGGALDALHDAGIVHRGP